MTEEKNNEQLNRELESLNNEELMDFFSKVDEQIKYLNNSILVLEEEE